MVLIICQNCNRGKRHYAKKVCWTCYKKLYMSKTDWKKYYQDHKEKRQLTAKQCYLKHQEKYIFKQREYYQKNKIQILQKNKEYIKTRNKKYISVGGYWKDYYQRNREKRVEQARHYQEKNSEKIKERRKKNYQQNKEKILTSRKIYLQKTDNNSKYYQKNKDKERQRMLRYKKTERGKMVLKLRTIRRLTRERNAETNLKVEELIELFNNPCCAYCGSIDKLTLDHLIPVAKGGKTEKNNLVLACHSCNASKGKKDLLEWVILKNIKLEGILLERTS